MTTSSSKFPIPSEFKDILYFAPCADTRTDKEILAVLNQHTPVFSERNVWTYWHSGLLSMPEWQQRNVCDWVRRCGSRWTVRVLDSQPDSPNNALRFFPPELVPACFRDGTMDGPYPRQHAADFVRGACVYTHGGIWSDAGQILLRSFDQICWEKLEDPETPFNVCVPSVNSCMIANFFIAARKGDPFIKRWHELFCALWEGKTNFRGVSQHPLWKNLELEPIDLWGENYAFDLEVTPETLNEYIAQMVCWVRICMLEGSPVDDFNGTEYWQKHILLFKVGTETLGAEDTIGFESSGPRMFKLLSSKLDADPDSEEYKEAYRMVWRVLSRSSTQKIAGSKMLKTVNLGTIWNMPENKGKDREPGTFADLLRYGSVNYEQNRELIYVQGPLPRKTIKKAHLEP